MKVICMHLAVWLANIVYLPFRLLKTKKKAVILSRQSDVPTLDILLLAEEFEKQGIEYTMLTKKLNKSIISAVSYAFHMLAQMYHIAVSEMIVLDGYCILVSVLPKKKGQKVLQMWHSMGAIKKFGWQTIGKQWGSSVSVAETMKLHRNYDYAIAPSKITADHFSEAFHIDRDKIILLGLPRIDYLLQEAQDKVSLIKSSYPQISEKINVLYAPTFRRNSGIEIAALIDSFDFSKFNLILKKHWLDKTDYSWAEEKGVIIDEVFSSLDWMKVCTKVITDYSAISLEAAIMEKELYLYIADMDIYSDKVGTNVDFKEESISCYVHKDAAELGSNLKEKYDLPLLRQFKEKYIEADTKNCAAQLAEFVKELLLQKADKE